MTTIPVTPTSDTELSFEATLPAEAGDYSLVLLDAQDREVGSAADVVSVVATPTAPVIFDSWPRTAEPYENVTLTIWGWLLDAGDCLGYRLDGQGGGGNMSQLDFTNTGLTLPWPTSFAVGSWTFDIKQGGSGGAVIASLASAIVIPPIHADSVSPATAISGVATDFVITGGGFQQCDGVQVRDAADVLIVDCPRTGGVAASNTEVAFTATIPTAGTYDLHLTVNMDMGPGIRMPDAITVTA